MLIITTTSQLEKLVEQLQNEGLIGIDTEFVRRTTYHAKLALIQIATRTEIYLIDPLNLDLTCFGKILINKKITKIFHAPNQDLTIFHRVLEVCTNNVFDTQEAAKYCSIKPQISYQEICKIVLEIEIEKEQQFRDWLARPVSAEMLTYAAQDVQYLIPLCERLKKEMQAYYSVDKFLSNMEIYNDKDYYKPNIEKLTQKIKTENKSPEFVQRLQMITSLREDAAILQDLPRQHILKDEDIVLIAKKLPRNIEDFKKLRIHTKLGAVHMDELFDLCTGIRETLYSHLL